MKAEPIATAPRDGTRILALRVVDGRLDWGYESWWEVKETKDAPIRRWRYYGGSIKPTHWLELPEFDPLEQKP